MPLAVRIVTVSLAAAALLAAEAQPRTRKLEWKSGQILSAEIAGHGRPPRKLYDGTPIDSRSDIWWIYRIDVAGRVYSASARANPAKARLEAGRSAWFAVSHSRIYVLNDRHKQYVLQIVRDDPAKEP